MTPEKWKEWFESETIVSRQLVVSTGDHRYCDPCNGELKKDQEYVLLIGDTRNLWLEDRPEHGVFPSHWFEAIEDLPLKPKEWKPKVGENIAPLGPAEADQAMIRADEYNRVGEAREPSERERAWEQAKHQTEIASYSADAICRGTARVTGHRLSRAIHLTEARAIHPQAMCQLDANIS